MSVEPKVVTAPDFNGRALYHITDDQLSAWPRSMLESLTQAYSLNSGWFRYLDLNHRHEVIAQVARKAEEVCRASLRRFVLVHHTVFQEWERRGHIQHHAVRVTVDHRLLHMRHGDDAVRELAISHAKYLGSEVEVLPLPQYGEMRDKAMLYNDLMCGTDAQAHALLDRLRSGA